MRIITFSFLVFIVVSCLQVVDAASNEPVLTIQSQNKRYHYTRSALLKASQGEQITMSNNRAYPGKTMRLDVIKLCSLLKPYHLKATDMVEFISTDDFSVYIPATKITKCDQQSAIGYLAIEPPQKWPLLANGTGATAGPFDVVWVNPEKSYISNEYWAWSVTKLVIHPELDSDTLKLKPKTTDKHLQRGFEVYVSHCAGCHSINYLGKGVIGPDLNYPKNPVEYYPDDKVLKKFIRDPQSVRTIKNDRMSGSGEDFLSESDLNDLISYFHYIAKQKQ